MYVCVCEGVTDKQIKKAIERGATSIRQLRSELGITRQCGECGRCTKAILNEHNQRCSHTDKPSFADSFALSFTPIMVAK